MGNKLRFYADLQSLQSDVTGSHNLVTVSYPDGRKEPFLVDFGLYKDLESKKNGMRRLVLNRKSL